MDCSIIIVSWNVQERLKECLESIYHAQTNSHFEVYVIDNNSSDGSAAMVAESFPEVTLIRNKHNAGFAAACNQGIRSSNGDTILLLNPDTILKDNALDSALAFLRTTENAGIVGCRITFPDSAIQPSVRAFPDLVSHVLILLKLHHFFPRTRSLEHYHAQTMDYQQTQAVDQVMGAFFLIDKKLIQEIGLLDEGFYIWYEEVDFCKRAAEHGWRTYYYAGTTVLHHKGASFVQRTPFRLQLIFTRSMVYYFFKHAPLWQTLLLCLVVPISIALATLQSILHIQKNNREF